MIMPESLFAMLNKVELEDKSKIHLPAKVVLVLSHSNSAHYFQAIVDLFKSNADSS